MFGWEINAQMLTQRKKRKEKEQKAKQERLTSETK